MADGMGCKCFASSENECCCEGVDWTPAEWIADRKELEQLRAENAQLRKDAESWLAYQARKVRLTEAGFGKSPLR